MACGRREPPRLVNLHSFGPVASLVNTLPKRLQYATGKYTLRNFSCMVITSCKRGWSAYSGAELVLGGNLLYSVLMACGRCILYMDQNTITL